MQNEMLCRKQKCFHEFTYQYQGPPDFALKIQFNTNSNLLVYSSFPPQPKSFAGLTGALNNLLNFSLLFITINMKIFFHLGRFLTKLP